LNTREDYHVHCNYNDHSASDLTIQNVIRRAREIGLQNLAFTEHVRKNSEWVSKYLEEIEFYKNNDKKYNNENEEDNDKHSNSKDHYNTATSTTSTTTMKTTIDNLKIISGFEAKILSDGSVNCEEQYSENYFLIASFHNIYGDKQIWINALYKAIENPDVNVIGHIAPEPTFTLEKDEVDTLASMIARNNKIVEINAKYRRPPPGWILAFKKKGVKFHLGSDAHSLQQIGQFEKVADLISLVDG
jgi:putative hydrolase